MDWKYHRAFSWGSGGSRVVPYSETWEIEEGANYKSISAMPQYKCRSHEELRFEDYVLHKRPTFHSKKTQNQGNAFQQSSSLFGPCTSSAPEIQFSFGAATAAKPTFGSTSTGFGVSPSSFGGSTGIGFVHRDPKSAALGTSTTKTFGASNNSGGGFRTSTVGFSSTSMPKGPSISGSKVSTTPGFGIIPGFGIPYLPGFGIPLTPVPSFSSNGTSLSGTSSNCVSTAYGFTFGSTSASGSNGISLSGTSSNRVSTANGFTFGSTSASGSNDSSLSGTSSNCVSTATGFTFGSTSAFGGNSAFGVKKSIGSTDKSATRLQGSRIASYSATGVVEKGGKRDSFVKLQSISAMPCYGDKGHEELRLEDYELGDKGWQMLWTYPFPFTKPSVTVSPSHSTPVTSDPWSSIASGSSQPQQTVEEEDKPGPVSPFMPQEVPTFLIDISSLSLHSVQDSNGDEAKDNSSSSQPDEHSTRLTEHSASAIQLPNQHEDEVAATTERRKADIAAQLPKLSDEEYYTEPSLGELAAKEMAEAGFCSHVKDFVVGRRGYGSIKFVGETDVRHLDVQSVVQINNGEVIVYHDKKKPQVEQHLINKAAEITLLNVKCIDKKTGKQYVEGRHVERYKEKLMNKYQEQGWEFVSYDPVEGEWKVRVRHF